MTAFPNINRQTVTGCFDALVALYAANPIKILDMAVIVLAGDLIPFTINAGTLATQIAGLRRRIDRVGNNYGRNFLILFIEELHKDLIANNGAIGVSMNDFCRNCVLDVENGYKIFHTLDGKWKLDWTLPLQLTQESIVLPIRSFSVSNDDIVPKYIIQYVNQAIIAYRNESYLTSLALISIALEGTLRDALEVKGYSYSHGAQTIDSYEVKEVDITLNGSDFNVRFRDIMPRISADFLSEPGSVTPHTTRIKRIKKNGRWFLEIRGVDYLKDFWSSDVIAIAGQINIGGLGTALSVSRNPAEANILDNSILPDDIDLVIQEVRNNLIHLSGIAMTTPITTIGMSLENFVNDQSRVFDTLWAICGAIDILYTKKSDGTL